MVTPGLASCSFLRSAGVGGGRVTFRSDRELKEKQVKAHSVRILSHILAPQGVSTTRKHRVTTWQDASTRGCHQPLSSSTSVLEQQTCGQISQADRMEVLREPRSTGFLSPSRTSLLLLSNIQPVSRRYNREPSMWNHPSRRPTSHLLAS